MTQLILQRTQDQCAAITRRIAFVGVFGMLAISIATVVDIGLRAILNAPITGFNEVVQMLMAVAIAACFPAGFSQRIHLTVDFLENNLSEKRRLLLKTVGNLLLLIFYVFMAWQMATVAHDLAEKGRTTIILGWSVAPFLWTVSALFAISVFVQFILVVSDIGQSFSLQVSGLVLTGLMLLITVAAVVLGFNHIVIFLKNILPGSPLSLALLFFLLLWAMILFLVPVAAAMGLIGLLGIAISLGSAPALTVVGTESVEFLTNINLAVLPLFLMMGSFASVAGLSSDIYGLAHALFGHRRGGLALATIGGCAGFGALTGSSLATAVTMGRVALPEMRQRGYQPGLATGCVAAGGTLGQLVPPSAAIVVFAILVEESIGRLFIGAILPALVAVILYMITISIYVRVYPDAAPGRGKLDFELLKNALRQSILSIILFVTVIGGIYGGIFTATEAAAVGAVGAFLIALFRGRLSRDVFWDVMGETTATTALIYALILSAVLFSFFIGAAGLPNDLVTFIRSLQLEPYTVIALLLFIYLLLGAIMDPFAMMVITVPIVAPIVTDMGFDIIWWGIVMVSIVETGLITPPFGLNVFVLKPIVSDVPLQTIFKGVLPFVAADIVRIIILVAFPALVLWLPSTMIN